MTATPASPDAAAAPACDMQQDRYARGLERLNQITKGQGQAVVEALSRTSPDLARFVIEYPYGDVACRPGLTLPQRQLAKPSAASAGAEGAYPRRVECRRDGRRDHRDDDPDVGLCRLSRDDPRSARGPGGL